MNLKPTPEDLELKLRAAHTADDIFILFRPDLHPAWRAAVLCEDIRKQYHLAWQAWQAAPDVGALHYSTGWGKILDLLEEEE
jgi:hypothetical protein